MSVFSLIALILVSHLNLLLFQLRDTMLEVMKDSGAESNKTPLDMYQYAGRATLDVIGSAGVCFVILFHNVLLGSLGFPDQALDMKLMQ